MNCNLGVPTTFALSLSLLLLTGCATATWQYVKLPNQSKVVETPGWGRIYVFRSQDGGKAPANIWDGNQLVGNTGPQGFVCWERRPGKTIITSSYKSQSRVPLTVAAGEVYYLVQKVAPGWLYAKTSLEAVSESEGQALLKNSKRPNLDIFAIEHLLIRPPSSDVGPHRREGGIQALGRDSILGRDYINY